MADAIEQEIAISTGQIPATDAARKKHVATNQQLVLARVETKTPGTMTGHFEHLKFRAQKISGRRLLNKEIRSCRFDLQLEAEVPEKVAI